jgi:hypothetical protein
VLIDEAQFTQSLWINKQLINQRSIARNGTICCFCLVIPGCSRQPMDEQQAQIIAKRRAGATISELARQ